MAPSPLTGEPASAGQPPWAKALDHRDRGWWSDFAARTIVWLGGMSAILFIAAIFLFIATQGLEFMRHRLDIGAMLTGARWEPTVEPPVYGALPLIAGTAWITGVAMLIAIPLAFGAAI